MTRVGPALRRARHLRRALGPPGGRSTCSAPRSARATTTWSSPAAPTCCWSRPASANTDRADGRRPRRRAARLGAPGLRRPGADRPRHEHAHVPPPGHGRQPGAARARGVEVIEPGTGLLADGEVGVGRLADPADIADAVEARARRRGHPRRAPGAGERRGHARADRPGALRGQPLQRAHGLGGGRGGAPARGARSPCSPPTSTCRATRTSATSTPRRRPTCTRAALAGLPLVRRAGDGRRRRRLPPGRPPATARSTSRAEGAPGPRPGADRRHPRRPRRRGGSARCWWASRPSTAPAGLERARAKRVRKRLDLIVHNDVSVRRHRVRLAARTRSRSSAPDGEERCRA